MEVEEFLQNAASMVRFAEAEYQTVPHLDWLS